MGAGELMAGLQVGRPVDVLSPLGVIAVAAPWPMGTQAPLPTPTQALNRFRSVKRLNHAMSWNV